ncbi:MAG: DNA polymerase I [Planctomycetaceae bacterium]|jgi:DNA polymerase-1|nr:DNA polymerase I [Planctomycetaceae bacterium]
MTAFILDAHGLLYQQFHALPLMNSPLGEPVNAVFGFSKDLFAVIKRNRPDVLLCAFDLPEKTFRSDIYSGYKANRSAMPEELRPQIESAKEIIRAFDIPLLAAAGFEADDILATAAAQCTQRGEKCVIVTSDKDCRQLISSSVSLYQLRKHVFYGQAELAADWGITPDKVIDFQSLVGDATDNVPGVPHIGPKTAAELLKQFGSLEGIYENLNKIGGKKQEYLANGKDSAFLSRRLVTLRTDVPLNIDWNSYTGFDTEKLRPLFQRFGFASLLEQLPLIRYQSSAVRVQNPNKQPLSLDNCILVDTPKKFESFYSELLKQKVFSFDTETVPMDNRFEATMPRYTLPAGMSFAWNETEAFYLPFRGPLGSALLDLPDVLEKLRPVFENPNVAKVGQNLKYDVIVLRNAAKNAGTAEIRLQGLAFDTMLADYLLRPEMPHNLDDMAEYYIGHKTIKISELIGSGKKQKQMDDIMTDIVAVYAGEDALVAWKIYLILKERIDADKTLSELYYHIELPLAGILADMEFTGICVDSDILKKLGIRFAEKETAIEEEIYALAGHPFNTDSPKQTAAVLFDELALPIMKKSKTGPSTDSEVLEELAILHPLPAKMLEYRQLAKLKGTYIDALPKLIHPLTGRIHCSFNQAATATGRLSSSSPNLQNIPVRMPEGKEIRSAFVPDKGYDYLLSCDYSQIELRVLAHFSGDERLGEAFRNGEDVHTRVAAEVFNVAAENVDKSMRRTAKAVNFGVIYGQTAFGLAKQLGIDRKEAQRFIDGYFERYSSVRRYIDSVLEECSQRGYVETLFGHRRYFRSGTVRYERKADLNQAERMAINTVIQGTAADLIKQAMVRLAASKETEAVTSAESAPPSFNLLLQIHDELVFEVTKEAAESLQQLVVQTMLLDQPLRVPLSVDAELTKRLG